jgi:hypothetical protein
MMTYYRIFAFSAASGRIKATAGIKMTDAEQSMVPHPPKLVERVKSVVLRARQR